jgi:hypothetical protein
MRYHSAVFGLLVLACGACAPAGPSTTSAVAEARFPIVVQGRWGFIDSTGAVVVAPRFAQVQEFSEGWAPVREAGHYGFIDGAGHLALTQRYDYASPFYQGLAVVQRDSTPQLIDRAGRLVPLAATYTRLEWQAGLDRGGVWVGTLATNGQQLLSARGQLLMAAAFKKAGALSNNRLVVERAETPTDANSQPQLRAIGVLNSRGQWVIPYYRFTEISTFREGVATAELYQPAHKEETISCLIDTTGRILARLPTTQRFYHRAQFADGVIPVRVSAPGGGPYDDNSRLGCVDRTGRLLFQDTTWQQLSNFSHGRAWAQDRSRRWHLLTKTGRSLTTLPIERIMGSASGSDDPTFAAGVELVALADGYAALDSSGRIVRRLAVPQFAFNVAERLGDILTFYAPDSTHPSGLLGFWNWRTGLLVKARFATISPVGYQHGLLAVLEDNRLGYLSTAGRYVWRQAPGAARPLNIDYMRRSFYPVASPSLARYEALGGWGRSGNLPKRVTPRQFPAHLFCVQAAPAFTPSASTAQPVVHKLFIANTTADTVVCDAQDSSLPLVVQAKNARGQWQDIEYTPSSWCGNSYHQVFLAPGRYWQVAVPAYTGEFATQLRAKLLVRQSAKQPRVVYSNSFAGSVNPAQFWRVAGYSPQGIMDPYEN